MAGIDHRDFLGIGWRYPVATDPLKGDIALSSYDRDVREAIRIIIETKQGERVMRPRFGCGIHDLVFATTNSTLAGLISREVRASLLRWEPRIEVDDVVVTFDAQRSGLAYIDVSYVLSSTNDRRNLVVPFYAIPEED